MEGPHSDGPAEGLHGSPAWRADLAHCWIPATHVKPSAHGMPVKQDAPRLPLTTQRCVSGLHAVPAPHTSCGLLELQGWPSRRCKQAKHGWRAMFHEGGCNSCAANLERSDD